MGSSLIVERGGVSYRVQVRTVNRRGDGSLASTLTKPGADLLCIVARDDFSIVFVPDITSGKEAERPRDPATKKPELRPLADGPDRGD